MTERKKKKLEQDVGSIRELLEALKNMEKESSAKYEAANFVSEVKTCLENLKDRETRPYAILAISQIFKLLKSSSNMFSTILDDDALNFIFESVLKCITEDKADISGFVSELIFIHFKNTQIIWKFFEAYTKTAFNREMLKQILAMFIETSSDREMLVGMVLKKYDSYLDFIPRIIKYVDVEKLDEDLYVKIYCDCQFFRENTEPRIVKGRKRRGFIENALDLHPEFVLKNYIRDRDHRIRILLAGKVSFSSEPYFSILLNDSEDEVRLALLKRMNYFNVPPTVSDRLLDKSARIREELFRMYRELIHQMRIIDSSHSLKLFEDASDQPAIVDGKLGFQKEHAELSLDEMYEKFTKFFSKLSEGCLTCFSEEYISEIRRSGFSLEFLSKNEDVPGLRVFLKTMCITNFNQIPAHLRSFCLEYMFAGTLNDAQIRECIQNNVFEVLKYIADPYHYYDLLLEKTLTSTDMGSVEVIVEFIKEMLSFKPLIRSKKNMPSNDTLRDTVVGDSDILNSMDMLTSNEIFINSHTKASTEFVEMITAKIGSEVDYSCLYFFVYKCRSDPRTIQSILKSKANVSERIRLLIYLNLPETLGSFVDLILRCKLDYRTQQFILLRRTTTSALIYFLSTGHVSISNSSFFIKAIKCCLASSSPDKVEYVFKRYVKSVKESAFNVFYSICWILKGYSVTNIGDQNKDTDNSSFHEIKNSIASASDHATHNSSIVDSNDSLVLNPMIAESTKPSAHFDAPRLTDTVVTLPNAADESLKNPNILSKTQDGINENTAMPIKDLASEGLKSNKSDEHRKSSKLRLTKQDKMLQCICNAVVSARDGQCIDIAFNPTKHGFFKLRDCHVDMVSYGQVVYE
ncbi:uncharacterized protein VICG_01053 [Vittaforma corneae ATCC 50505]|uniref:Uncharacterized protein n=1 Tax=Vittaforma corneae (strain ATCC 50505) TaxID=993615 RepID=L2GMK6_VITCO|nr:uncharacterized protein VICG_01053 [Vittaforma corneae ATCC 50505]ELA41869.1 hypothetical protein VICG_01053 [Vittaforma corneae ATCC 50505]